MSTVALRDCCRFLSGGTPSKSNGSYWKGSIPWFSPKDIKHFDLISSEDYVTEDAIRASATKKVQAGTILVVGRSGVLAHTLPVGVVRRQSAFNQDIKAIVPHETFDPEFVALFLKAQQARVLSNGVKVGATVHSLKSGFLESLRIPDIEYAKQRRLASRLKVQLVATEKARHAACEQLSELRRLAEAVIDAALIEAEGSPVTQIGAVAKVQSGYAFKSSDFKTEGVRLLRNANVSPGRVFWDDAVFLPLAQATSFERFALNEHDIVISLDRPLISSGLKVARVGADDLPSLLVQRVGRFDVDVSRLDPDYLHLFLKSQRFIGSISGHDQSLGVPHISPGQVEAVELPLPSVECQRTIAARLGGQLATITRMRAAAQAQLGEIEALPARLLAKAFNPTDEGASP